MAWTAGNTMAAQGALNSFGSIMSMRSAASQSRAAREQALNEVDRLHDEMRDVRDQYRGQMDDRAREADYQMGALIAAMADNGGAGTQNQSRLAGEIAYFEGVDIARLDKSKMSKVKSLKSAQVAANQSALNVQTRAWQGAMDSWMQTGTSAAQSYIDHKFKLANSKALKTQKPKPQPTSGR